MPRASQPSRVGVLERRVAWLDRHRRDLALAITALVCPLLLVYGHSGLGDYVTSEWPRLPALVIILIASVLCWAITETALAWMTAVWETEAVSLFRQHQIPPARLVRRRHQPRKLG